MPTDFAQQWHVCEVDYVAWHAEAGRRHRRGERQRQCPRCWRWVWRAWPEDAARHDADCKGPSAEREGEE